MVSRPALAAITAMYGNVTAPIKAIQRQGDGRITASTKQIVLIIIEIKYLRCLAD